MHIQKFAQEHQKSDKIGITNERIQILDKLADVSELEVGHRGASPFILSIMMH